MNTVLIILLLLYNIWLVTYMMLEKNKKPHSYNDKIHNGESEKSEKSDSIIGKSKFKMQDKVPNTTNGVPKTATEAENEDIPDMPVTFADETEEKKFSKVEDENLDKTFEDKRITDVDTEYDDDIDVRSIKEYAVGSTFEDITKAVNIADNPKVNQRERELAKEVFSQMEGNDFYNKLIENNSSRAKRIHELMAEIPTKNKTNEAKGKPAKRKNKAEVKFSSNVDEFNIRDFV